MQHTQSDQYKAYRTNLLQSVFNQFIFVWYPKRRSKRFPNDLMSWERFNPTRDGILDCFIPQNKLLRIISIHTGNNITILTSVHSPHNPPGISCKLFRVNQRWIGWVETSLHSSIQSCWVRLVVSVASNLIQKNSCTDSIKSIFTESKTKNRSKIPWNFGGNRNSQYTQSHQTLTKMKRFKQYWSTFEKTEL